MGEVYRAWDPLHRCPLIKGTKDVVIREMLKKERIDKIVKAIDRSYQYITYG